MIQIKEKKETKLEKIKESTELNENIDDDSIKNNNINKNKSFYGVDFDIYSKKSSFSEKSEKNGKKEINIEMEDLSVKKDNKYNYEMSDYSNEEKEENNYETIKDIHLNYKNNNNFEEKKSNNEESPKSLKNDYISMNKDEKNYDGDYYSDDEI